MQQKPSHLYIQAIEKTHAKVISHAALQEIYHNSQIGDKLGRLICEQLYVNKEIRESSLILDSPDERFHRLVETKKEWVLRIPQYHLASYLNLAPETLSRIKKRNFKN